MVDVPVSTSQSPHSPYKNVATRSMSIDDFNIYEDEDARTTNDGLSEDGEVEMEMEDEASGKEITQRNKKVAVLKKINVIEFWKKWNFTGDYQI